MKSAEFARCNSIAATSLATASPMVANGTAPVEQASAFGRAEDTVTLAVPSVSGHELVESILFDR